MEVVYSIDDLTEDAVDFWTGHFSGHDDGEEVVGGVFHDLSGGGRGEERGGKEGRSAREGEMGRGEEEGRRRRT